MERAMGIEPKRTMLPGLKNKRFGVIATPCESSRYVRPRKAT
jgi:hypothetical protein